MKKLFTITLIFFAFATLAIAQDGFSLYKIKTIHEADIVLKALNNELKLTETAFSNLRDLLYGSARSQEELFLKKENMNAESVQGIVIRQTGHIEGNLQNLVGKDKFKIYLQKKPAIEKKVQEMGKN